MSATGVRRVRLAILDSGHDRVSGLGLRLMSLVMRDDATDILKVVFYRTHYFGTPFSDLVDRVLRGSPSFWTVGERELFASYTAQTNQCPFCATVHRDFAGSYLGDDLVDAALAAPTANTDTNGDLRPEARAVLGFLDKMSRHPDALTGADVEVLHRAGVDDDAIAEVVEVGSLFHVISRVMNAVGATVPNRRQRAAAVRFVGRFGYRLPAPIRVLSRAR